MDRYLKRAADENVEDPKKKKRDVSVAWDHFKKTVEKTHGICNYCGKAIKTAGNTTNLLDHLKHVHPDRLKDGKSQQTNTMDVYVGRAPFFYNNDSTRKRCLDMKVMRMIAVDVQPFSCVEDEGFKELMKEMDPRYKLPSRSHLRDVVLPSQYEELKNKLMAILANVDFLALTTDMWTSRANEGYITITCHFVSNNFKLESAILATRQLLVSTNHTASNIAETMKAVLEDWGVTNKVVCIVTDNDATMVKACRLLQYKHLPCVAHTINLLVQDILKMPCIDDILTKCKTIVAFFKRSQVAYAKFKEAQGENPCTLLQEMPTRWNSAFAMIKRILKTNEFVSLALISCHNAPSPFSAAEVDILKDIAALLSPFEDATLSVSSNSKVSVSLIIPVICELQHKIKEINLETAEGKLVFEFIKTRLGERLAAYETRTIPRISTIIDPRFKKQGFLSSSNAEEAAKAVQDELFSRMSANPHQPTPTPTPEPTRFSFLKVKAQSKVHSSWADAIILLRQHIEKENQPEKCDPLTYWEMTTDGEAFKTLAKKFLCVPASSCESERVFSKAGQLISDRRTRLSSTVVDKILFLNKNIHLNIIE